MTEYTMVQFRLPPGPATLADAARQLGIPVAAFDAGYGVVPTDPADRLFVAMVDAAAMPSDATASPDPAVGAFANPPIAPFGPPES